MRNTIRLVLTDLASGDPQSALGILDYLTVDKGYDLTRLLLILQQKFGVPYSTSVYTLSQLLETSSNGCATFNELLN